MATAIETKAQILHDLYIYLDAEGGMADFVEVHDLGIPLSVLIVQGHATATMTGIDWINADFDDLCEYLEIDKYGEYESLEDVLEMSALDA